MWRGSQLAMHTDSALCSINKRKTVGGATLVSQICWDIKMKRVSDCNSTFSRHTVCCFVHLNPEIENWEVTHWPLLRMTELLINAFCFNLILGPFLKCFDDNWKSYFEKEMRIPATQCTVATVLYVSVINSESHSLKGESLSCCWKDTKCMYVLNGSRRAAWWFNHASTIPKLGPRVSPVCIFIDFGPHESLKCCWLKRRATELAACLVVLSGGSLAVPRRAFAV